MKLISYLFMIVLLHQGQPQCITYSTEQVSIGELLGKSCRNDGYVYHQPYEFGKEFCEIPQLFIQSVRYSNQQAIQFYRFQIISLTKTGFEVTFQCLNSGTGYISAYQFSFVALIDEKIFVINDFMQSITLTDGARTNIIPYPIENKEFEVSPTILSYGGGIPNVVIEKQLSGFNLYITGVDSTQLAGLGIQIIAALQTDYYLFDSLTINCNEQKYFKEMTLRDYKTHIFVIALMSTHDHLFGPGYILYDTLTHGKGIQFWAGSIDSPCTNSLTVKAGLFLYSFSPKPHYYKKTRIASLMNMSYKFMTSFDTYKLYFKELDKTWDDVNTGAISAIAYNSPFLSLIYYFQCQPNVKVILTVLRLGKNGEYEYTMTKNCHALHNLVTLHIYLYQSRPVDTKLTFSLTNQEISLQEFIVDSEATYDLFKIKIEP